MYFYVFYQDKSIGKPGDDFTKKNPLLHHAKPLVNSEFMAKPLVIWSLPETGFLWVSKTTLTFFRTSLPDDVFSISAGHSTSATWMMWMHRMGCTINKNTCCGRMCQSHSEKIHWFEGFHTHKMDINGSCGCICKGEKRNLHESIPCHHKISQVACTWQWFLMTILHGQNLGWNLHAQVWFLMMLKFVETFGRQQPHSGDIFFSLVYHPCFCVFF